MNILIVEDEIDILETISDTLEIEFDEELVIDTALNGQLALDCFALKEYDLIITDLNMPIMDGIEFTQKIRNKNKSIPILVFTGHGDVAEIDKLNEIGVQAMIKKPYIQKLIQEIRLIIKT